MQNVAEFIKLIDHAIASAESLIKESAKTGQAWMVEDATTAIKQFQRIKDDALTGHLIPSKGAGLGITRALSEWAPKDVYAAGKAVEDYYRLNWN